MAYADLVCVSNCILCYNLHCDIYLDLAQQNCILFPPCSVCTLSLFTFNWGFGCVQSGLWAPKEKCSGWMHSLLSSLKEFFIVYPSNTNPFAVLLQSFMSIGLSYISSFLV